MDEFWQPIFRNALYNATVFAAKELARLMNLRPTPPKPLCLSPLPSVRHPKHDLLVR
jgi:hypothetical protein